MRTTLRWLVVAVVTGHGVIHLMGAAKGFGWADLTELSQPVSALGGAGWLLATLLVLTSGVLLAARARLWWAAMATAALVSQAVILTAWADAWAGTAANAVMLLAAGYGYLSQGPGSFRVEYRRRAGAAPATPVTGAVAEADLAALPGPVAGYLRRSGAVGRPRVTAFAARVHGRIRGGRDKPWMAFTGEQVNTYGPRPQRLFLMDATMFGLPVDVLHVYDASGATMRARVCSAVPIVDASGPDMERAETVTLFNDLCVLAPAALVDAPVCWQTLDDRRVRATYTNGAETITAELVFNDEGDLVDFVSDDRLRAAPDGRTFTPQRWSTPLHNYQHFGSRRLSATGEGHWHAPPPEGEFTYLEFHLDDITYNPHATPATAPDGPVATSVGPPTADHDPSRPRLAG